MFLLFLAKKKKTDKLPLHRPVYRKIVLQKVTTTLYRGPTYLIFDEESKPLKEYLK